VYLFYVLFAGLGLGLATVGLDYITRLLDNYDWGAEFLLTIPYYFSHIQSNVIRREQVIPLCPHLKRHYI